MDIVKIAVIGLIGTILASTFRNDKNYGIFVAIATGIVLFFLLLPSIADILNNFVYITQDAGINSQYVTVMIKALGIAYVSMFSAQICRDFNQNSIADKIELGGKVIILLNAMTIMNELIEEMLGFIV